MNCLLCSSEDHVDVRGVYPVCRSCKAEQEACSDRLASGEMLDRDCGPLCMQCGLCCVVLSAQATSEEVEHLANWSGRLPSDLAMVEVDPFPAPGKLVLHRPCVFLLGKPTEYVRCQAYETRRPVVCEEYLCRMAIRYKAGLCTLNEALFILRSSITHRGSVSDFNWSAEDSERDKNDHKIAELLAARRVFDMLNANDERANLIKLYLFKQIGDKYEFGSDTDEAIFGAIMVNFSNNAIELDQFFEDGLIDDWSERDREVAMKTIYQVVGDFKDLFTKRT